LAPDGLNAIFEKASASPMSDERKSTPNEAILPKPLDGNFPYKVNLNDRQQ
jgi:hypothetical protein